VSTLSVLREVHAPPILRNCIFGEATLNDALSIVLFNVVRAHYHTLGGADTAERITVLRTMAHDLVWSLGGSLMAGCGCGLLLAFFTRRLKRISEGASVAPCPVGTLAILWRECERLHRPRSGRALPGTDLKPLGRDEVPHAELSLLTICGILTFTASERLGFSGIASLFACGVITRHYTFHNISRAAQSSASTLFLTLSTLCEVSLSTLLGVAAFDYLLWLDAWDFWLAVLTLPVLFIARALNIFPLSLVVNALRRGRKKPISINMQIVMWFSGMRGALSFALAISLDDPLSPHPLPSHTYRTLVATTLLTISITTLLMAPLTRPLIRAMRIGGTSSASNSLDGDDPLLPANNLDETLLQGTVQLAVMQPVASSTLSPAIPAPSPPLVPREGKRRAGQSIEVPLQRNTPGSPTEANSSRLYLRFREFERIHLEPMFGGRWIPF
jgi:sodium/hydrogen exchanger 8